MAAFDIERMIYLLQNKLLYEEVNCTDPILPFQLVFHAEAEGSVRVTSTLRYLVFCIKGRLLTQALPTLNIRLG